MGAMTCLKKLFYEGFTAIPKMGFGMLTFIKDFVLYMVETVMDAIFGSWLSDILLGGVRKFIDCISNPGKLFTIIFGTREEAMKAEVKVNLITVIRSYFFVNFNMTFYWGVISFVPVDWLDSILKAVLPLIPGGETVEKAIESLLKMVNAAKNALTGIMNDKKKLFGMFEKLLNKTALSSRQKEAVLKLFNAGLKALDKITKESFMRLCKQTLDKVDMSDSTKKHVLTEVEKMVTSSLTIGDVYLMSVKFADTYRSISAVFEEIYGWFVDIFGCFVSKFAGKTADAINSVFGAQIDKVATDTTAACCFKDFVEALKKQLKPTDVRGLFRRAYNATTGTLTRPFRYVIGKFYSDARLKVLLRELFSISIKGKKITFYLYKWTPEARAMLKVGDGLYIGVVAQQIQENFPTAVTSESGYLQVNLKKLPCNLNALLCNLNGLPPPKCRTEKIRLLENA
jgi:hypothetical protein